MTDDTIPNQESEQEETPQQDELPDCQKSLAYWMSVDADTNGMLGGYPQISRIDIQGSKTFLAKIRPRMPKDRPKRAVDCGAGIGRITKGFLAQTCETIDIVEPVQKFTDALSNDSEISNLGDIYNLGLQEWTPSQPYWLIWNQWCVGHLIDDDLVAYLKRCAETGAMIVVKENVATYADVYDPVDSSVTRTDETFRRIFEEAGLKIVKSELQKGFPMSLGLFPVRMYALLCMSAT